MECIQCLLREKRMRELLGNLLVYKELIPNSNTLQKHYRQMFDEEVKQYYIHVKEHKRLS